MRIIAVVCDSMTTEMTVAKKFRNKFPILNQKVHGMPLIYFDNGATTQKPLQVIEAHREYYELKNANVHRASHAISAQATQAFEYSRTLTAQFINASSDKEIIWTSGTTEAINIIAQCWGHENLTKDDEIIISVAEHHANLVPWQMLAKQTGAVLKAVGVDAAGQLDITEFTSNLSKRTKLVAINHISNVTGKINPVEEVIALAKAEGAKVLIDGAQAIAHLTVDVTQLDCDFYVFSAHKMFGPTGLGVLYGKASILSEMSPYQFGGEMIKSVSLVNGTTFNELPFKLEAGTPNISAVVSFSEAIKLIVEYRDYIDEQDKQLTQALYKALDSIEEVEFLFEGQSDIPLLAFQLKGHHNQDVSTYLDSQGIAIRAGHHCAMPLMEYLNINGCLRVSLAPYNTLEEIDLLVQVIKRLLTSDSNQEPTASVEEQASEVIEIIKRFKNASSWDKKHREIMLFGKSFTRMDKSRRTEDSVISGCESQAWLVADKQGAKYTFSADSDAKVVRGLLHITIAAYQGKTAGEIQTFDIEEYFEVLGLLHHLSPSRGNGLLAIVDKIRKLAV